MNLIYHNHTNPVGSTEEINKENVLAIMKFDRGEVLEIINLSKDILTSEDVIQKFEHEQKITIVGSTHGYIFNLLKLLKNNGWPEEKNPYIFNGNFVDHGANGSVLRNGFWTLAVSHI